MLKFTIFSFSFDELAAFVVVVVPVVVVVVVVVGPKQENRKQLIRYLSEHCCEKLSS